MNPDQKEEGATCDAYVNPALQEESHLEEVVGPPIEDS